MSDAQNKADEITKLFKERPDLINGFIKGMVKRESFLVDETVKLDAEVERLKGELEKADFHYKELDNKLTTLRTVADKEGA